METANIRGISVASFKADREISLVALGSSNCGLYKMDVDFSTKYEDSWEQK